GWRSQPHLAGPTRAAAPIFGHCGRWGGRGASARGGQLRTAANGTSDPANSQQRRVIRTTRTTRTTPFSPSRGKERKGRDAVTETHRARRRHQQLGKGLSEPSEPSAAFSWASSI